MQPGTILCPGLAAVGTEWVSKRTTQTTLARSPTAAASVAAGRPESTEARSVPPDTGRHPDGSHRSR